MLPKAIVTRLGTQRVTARRNESVNGRSLISRQELRTRCEHKWQMGLPPVQIDAGVSPALLIGYEGPNYEDDLPEWMHDVEHAYRGGSLCATGCLLPLAMNEGEQRPKLWVLTRALTELGGSWHHDAIHGPQGVDALKIEITKLIGSGRRESAMDSHEIAAMTELLTPYLGSAGGRAPAVEWGYDGCLQFCETDPSRLFDEWLTAAIWYPEVSDEPDDWPPNNGVWRPGVAYSSDIALELARWLRRSAPPRIFLLWKPTI